MHVREQQQAYSNQLSPTGANTPQSIGQNMAQGNGSGPANVPQPKPVSILSVHERVQKVQERLLERRSVWQDAVRQLEQADPLTTPNYLDLVMNASSLAHEYINTTDHYRSVVGGLYQ